MCPALDLRRMSENERMMHIPTNAQKDHQNPGNKIETTQKPSIDQPNPTQNNSTLNKERCS
jgi:hypothetical protein